MFIGMYADFDKTTGKMHLFCCVIAGCVVASYSAASGQTVENTPDNLIQKLFNVISDQQVKEEVPLVPLKSFHKKKGVYPSAMKTNVHGKIDEALTRRMIDIFDNNMFVTAWVSSFLLEAYKYGQAPKPTESQLMLGIKVLQDAIDLNKPYNSSMHYFWPLIYNEAAQFWHATEINILTALNSSAQTPLNLSFENVKHLGSKDLTSNLKLFIENNKPYVSSLVHICPDFDDTFLNLGLGSLLHGMRNKFPQAHLLWKTQNSNLTSIFDALKKYAYRPFHNDPQTDSIDPRTYMSLRFFLDDAEAAGKDVAIVTTWAQNLEELKTDRKKGVAMPLKVNDIDVGVCADTVYGITASVLSGLVSPDILQDAAIAQIYHNTSAVIAYEIRTNMSNRPDLSSLYYPSRMQLNWFVARTVAILDTARAMGPLPAPVMEEVYTILQNATKGSMTDYILSEAKEDEQGDTYYDDFLGDGDLTEDNQPLLRGEDRIFTTAVAVNALLCTWTHFDETSRKSSWKTDVPPQVTRAVSGSIQWLRKNIFSNRYQPWNAFFSASIKNTATFINQYPANLFQDADGNALPWSQSYILAEHTLAVKGYIPPTEYTAMLREKQSPLFFHGYNTPDSVFLFWCSESITYSATLSALSRYGNIVN